MPEYTCGATPLSRPRRLPRPHGPRAGPASRAAEREPTEPWRGPRRPSLEQRGHARLGRRRVPWPVAGLDEVEALGSDVVPGALPVAALEHVPDVVRAQLALAHPQQ